MSQDAKPKYRIWLSPPELTTDSWPQVENALIGNWIAPAGPELDAFEAELSRLLQCRPALAVNSGTAALHLALLAAGVQRGEEVIAPDFTYAATLHPLTYACVQPVLVDTQEHSPQLSADWLRVAIKDRLAKGRPLRAVMLAHLYGDLGPVSEVLDICREYDLLLIEDAAEALGAKMGGRPAGCWGDLAALSFNGNKIITTGGGGALLCSTEAQREAALQWAQQGRNPAQPWLHDEAGFNYRLSNVLAALGLAQLPALAERVERRKAVQARYREALRPQNGWNWFKPAPDVEPNYWLTAVWLDPRTGISPQAVIDRLAKAGIEARRLWRPMRKQPVYAGCPFYGSRRGDFWFDRGLCLPTGGGLSEADQAEIVALCREAVER